MYGIIVTALAVIFLSAFLVIFCYGGYFNKMLAKLGLAKRRVSKNWAVMAWESCLLKLKYKSDIAFLGDSITRGSDFGDVFDKKIVNLGMTGDTLEGMLKRVPMIKAVKPEKVFILGGINSLSDNNAASCVKVYDELVSAVKAELPDACIVIQSVLPISEEKEKSFAKTCRNTTILKFNIRLQELAVKHGAKYIDLHSSFFKNNAIDPELTKDGIHLNEQGYLVWQKAIEKYIQS